MKTTRSRATRQTKWSIALASLPALALLSLLPLGRADGGDGTDAALAPQTEAAATPAAGGGSLGAPPAPALGRFIPTDGVAPGDRSEPGDWSLVPERLATDRSARFRALELLASGKIPAGERRSELVAWLEATNDAEVIVILGGVLRDLEARRYAAATTDCGALLRRIAEGDESSRREAIDTIQPELLELESVLALLRGLASDDSDPSLARAAMLALAKSDSVETTAFLAASLSASAGDPSTRVAAASAMSLRKCEVAAKTLVERLADPAEDVLVKRFAARGLGMQESTDEVVRTLTEAYHGELDFTLRFNAVAALEAHAARPDVRRELESILESDPSDDIRALAMMSLAAAGHEVERVIGVGRRDASPKVRLMASNLASMKP